MSKFKDIDEELEAVQREAKIIDKVEKVGLYILSALASTIAITVMLML